MIFIVPTLLSLQPSCAIQTQSGVSPGWHSVWVNRAAIQNVTYTVQLAWHRTTDDETNKYVISFFVRERGDAKLVRSTQFDYGPYEFWDLRLERVNSVRKFFLRAKGAPRFPALYVWSFDERELRPSLDLSIATVSETVTKHFGRGLLLEDNLAKYTPLRDSVGKDFNRHAYRIWKYDEGQHKWLPGKWSFQKPQRMR